MATEELDEFDSDDVGEDLDDIDLDDEAVLDDDLTGDVELDTILDEDVAEIEDTDAAYDYEDEDEYDEDEDQDEEDEETEALDELEAEELELLEEEPEDALLVNEIIELRTLRREELTLDVGAEERRPDEFVCQSCFLVKRASALANRSKMICVDCAS